MMMLALFLLYLIGSACAGNQNVEYFAGRSGDIVIQSTKDVTDASAILLHGAQFKDNTLKSIEDTRIADLLAHVLGTQPFNTIANRKDFPKGDIFNKAKAALLVTLDSLSPELLSLDNYQRVEVTTKSFPSNTLSMASTIATGASPSTHGIIGEQWVASGENVKAYGNDGSSFSANIADVLVQEFSDALTISASASAPLASAFAANKRFATLNSFALSLKNGAFENTNTKSSGSLSLSKDDIESILNNPEFSDALGGIQYSNNKIVFAGATFNMDAQEDSALFAELSFVFNLFQVLKSNADLSALTSDDVPDFIALSFASLKSIKEVYGEKSTGFTASVGLVSKIVQYAVSQMDNLYGNRAVAVVASLNSNTVASSDAKAATLSVARNYVSEADFEKYYPSIYVSNVDANNLCDELKSKVADQSVTVNCFTSYAYLGNVYVDPSNHTGNHTVKPLNVPAFWIIFWIVIVFLAFILGGIYLLCSAGIEASKDSLLFRSTGRHLHQS